MQNTLVKIAIVLGVVFTFTFKVKFNLKFQIPLEPRFVH